MNALRTQNCRNHPLIVLGAGSAMFLTVYIATESSAFAGNGWLGFAIAGIMGITAGGWLLGKLSGLIFTATDSRLAVNLPGGALNILYQNISRIDRVRRTSGNTSETVRITYRRVGKLHTVELRPECAAALVWDILQHCPQLSRYKDSRVVRNRAFRIAEEDMEPVDRDGSLHLSHRDIY